ncbi:MAG: hypothetical protein ACK449_14785 [Planctomycetota bacterium]
MATTELPQSLSHLSKSHRNTYEAIFRSSSVNNLEWHDVLSLLNAIASVVEEHNGLYRVTRNGQSLAVHLPKHKDAPSEMVRDIRHFLELSQEASASKQIATGVLMIVVVDHHYAKVFRSEIHGTVPQRIEPYDPHGFHRHLISNNQPTVGKNAPGRKSFYEAIAATLRSADKILIFGHGAGHSSAMEQLVKDLKHHHSDVTNKIVGEVSLDWHHFSYDQILAKAREILKLDED